LRWDRTRGRRILNGRLRTAAATTATGRERQCGHSNDNPRAGRIVSPIAAVGTFSFQFRHEPPSIDESP
jgi:hypothetical protein